MANTATLTAEGKLEIRYDFTWELLNLVKTIPGRRFRNDKGKYWVAPVSGEAIRILKEGGFQIDQAAIKAAGNGSGGQATTMTRAPRKITINPLKKSLFPYQADGVEFVERKHGRALIGDEMGLGKTIQALAYLNNHPELRPAIILCPATLKLNWEREIYETLPGKQNVQVLKGTSPYPITGEIIIINYDILPNKYKTEVDPMTGKKVKKELARTGWVDFLIDLKPKVLVFDEAHYIKSSSALRTKATRKLSKEIPKIIALTGTPIVNRPVEGFNIVQIINRHVFPNFMNFARRYCDAKHNGFGWDFSGASNKEELHHILTRTIMIRRKKADVLPDLPDKLYSYIPVELDNAREYKRAERDFINWLAGEKGKEAAVKAKMAEHLVKIEALKQIAVKGKMDQATEWIRDFLDQNGNKLIVFATHKYAIDHLMKEFKGVAVKIDGTTPTAQREASVRAFQNDPGIKLFVGNIKAAGVGITLTAASSVAFLELPWTPGDLAQAEDRAHRIGQKDTVNVYYLLASGTIEETIAALLDDKRKVLDAVLDGKEADETQLLTELIKRYQNAA